MQTQVMKSGSTGILSLHKKLTFRKMW